MEISIEFLGRRCSLGDVCTSFVESEVVWIGYGMSIAILVVFHVANHVRGVFLDLFGYGIKIFHCKVFGS